MLSEASTRGIAAFEPCLTDQPSYLLVMTATVTPSPRAGVALADPRQRMREYMQALRFWLSYQHPAADHILLLENSGADLSEFRSLVAQENPHHKDVEILSIPGNTIPEGGNYGFAEMELLDLGLAQSRLRQTTTHLIKVTGRLIFPELGRALDRTLKPWDVLIDLRKLGFPRRGFDASVQVFAVSHKFYDSVLRGSRFEMNTTDVRLLEHLLARKTAAYRGQPGIHLRFPTNVEPVGTSGFSGRSYASPRSRLTSSIRAVLRKVAPNYWF